MKYSAILTSLSALALYTVATSAISNYDALEARDWVDEIFARNGDYPTLEGVATRDDLFASLTTRDLVNELEARLAKRAPSPSPTTPASTAEATPDVSVPQQDTTGQTVQGPASVGGSADLSSPSPPKRVRPALKLLTGAVKDEALSKVPPVAGAVVNAALSSHKDTHIHHGHHSPK